MQASGEEFSPPLGSPVPEGTKIPPSYSHASDLKVACTGWVGGCQLDTRMHGALQPVRSIYDERRDERRVNNRPHKFVTFGLCNTFLAGLAAQIQTKALLPCEDKAVWNAVSREA